MLRRKIFYIQVYPGHFMARVHGQTRLFKDDKYGSLSDHQVAEALGAAH